MPVVAKRFWIFVLAAFVLLILIIGAVSSTGQKPVVKPTPTPTPSMPTPTPQPSSLTFTVNSAVGIESIAYMNQNTGAKMVFIPTELPHTYTVKYGDTLSFKVTSTSGYRFNSWTFGDGSIHSPDVNGYLIIKITSPLIMDAHFLMEAQ